MSDISSRNTSMDMETDFTPLSSACIKALVDRLDDKRKFAASEIEKMTVEFSMSNNTYMVNRLITVLGQRFCYSHNQNTRKGGLLGLAAVMIGYKSGSNTEPSTEMVDMVIGPILTCLLDSDARVRYYACESLYNVIKVIRKGVLPHFQSIFDTLSRLVADSDVNVRAGSQNLDQLLKDIVVESSSDELNMTDFVTKLEEYVYTKNPFTRMFIISWIRLLDTKLDMTVYLPRLLEGILNCLCDSTEEICASTLVLLSEFLNKIINCPIIEEPETPPDQSKKVSINTNQQQSALQDPTQTNFNNFVRALYKTFLKNDLVSQERGKFIIVNLCGMTKPETVYRSFAEIIQEEKSDPIFARNMVQKLNQILLTARALSGFRSQLSNSCLEGGSEEMVALTNTLLDAWSHSKISSISLCLLTGYYKEARDLVMSLAKTEITMDLLVQVDWLVQLIESPIFSSLRLRLLDSDSSDRNLVQTLYGLLMILPQSETYKKLSHRLDQVHKFLIINR